MPASVPCGQKMCSTILKAGVREEDRNRGRFCTFIWKKKKFVASHQTIVCYGRQREQCKGMSDKGRSMNGVCKLANNSASDIKHNK